MSELEEINKEIEKLEAEKVKLEKLRHAKLELLKLKLENVPSRLGAEHPVVYSLLTAGGNVNSGSAKAASSYAKEALKATGKTSLNVAKGLANYLAWSKENPGKGWIQYLKYKKEQKKRLVQV